MLKKLLVCLLILTLCAVVFCSCIVDPDTDGEPTDTVSDTESVTSTDDNNEDDGNNDGGDNDDGNNDDGNNDDGNNDGGNNDQNTNDDNDLAYDDNWTPNY